MVMVGTRLFNVSQINPHFTQEKLEVNLKKEYII